VPELDEDPANYARTLAAAGYFEAIGFSDEDRARAEMYQGNARRLGLQNQTADLDSYLRSLEMRIVFGSFDRKTRARVTQLINKSNQFNLTTRRYSESQVEQLETDAKTMTLHARLIDKFGDNGIICIVICRATEPDIWTIDTWLMSCRVLGRRVEQAVLHEVLKQGRALGIKTLVGIYRPTDKNGMVRDHYEKLGFGQTQRDADGTTMWQLPVETEMGEVPIVVQYDKAQELV
jgi:FkbH-like protein